MTNKRHNRWRAQVLLAMMITVLAVTGLTSWLLPPGGAARSIRHLLRWIHEAAALGFLTLLAFHLYCHWEAIRQNLRRFGLWGRD